MSNIDNSFLKYRRMKIYRRILFFMIGFGAVLGFAAFYVYEWNRMPDVIYVEADKEQVIDLNIPVKGELYKESIETGAYVQPAIESISRGNIGVNSIEIDFSKEIILCGAEEEIYYADLKLFGVLPYRSIRIETVDTYEVIPSGQTIGIYVKTKGVYVIDIGDFESEYGENVMPCMDKLQSGDYILAVNGEEITRKRDFTQLVQNSEGQVMQLTIIRDDKELEVDVIPERALDGEYKIGAWIRDSLQGVGTMTMIDSDGNFVALGHAVRDADTNEPVDISFGTLYETTIVSVTRGEGGHPGEITGLIQYDNDKKIGEIYENTISGIHGTITESDWISEVIERPMEIALKQEIELGEAYIISAISGSCEKYSVEIIDINYNNNEKKRALTIKVTDKNLLELTGGIVQGMSGSPVIQNGRIIGAVTHVLVNDPTKGYAIFIENMLEHDN